MRLLLFVLLTGCAAQEPHTHPSEPHSHAQEPHTHEHEPPAECWSLGWEMHGLGACVPALAGDEHQGLEGGAQWVAYYDEQGRLGSYCLSAYCEVAEYEEALVRVWAGDALVRTVEVD